MLIKRTDTKNKKPLSIFFSLIAYLITNLLVLTPTFANPSQTPKIIQIAGHNGLSLALDENGNVYQWGSVHGTNFGTLAGNPIYYEPQKVSGLQNVKQIASGMASFALTEEGEVYAWGLSAYTGLGEATTAMAMWDEIATPQKLPLSNIQKIWSGVSYAYAMDNTGKVYAWGYDRGRYLDALTGNDGEHIYTPIEYPISGVKEIAVGYTSAFGLMENGEVYAWGANGDALGVGMDHTTLPIAVTPLKIDGLQDVVAIASGMNETLAVTKTGEVYAWGSSNYGNHMLLAEDTEETKILSPKKVMTLQNIQDVSTYSTHLAVDIDGHAYLWGYASNIDRDIQGGYYEEIRNIDIAKVKQGIVAGATLIFLTDNGDIYQMGTMFSKGGNIAGTDAQDMIMTNEPVLIWQGQQETPEETSEKAPTVAETTTTPITTSNDENSMIWIPISIASGLSLTIIGILVFLHLRKKKPNKTILLIHGYNGIPKIFNYFSETFQQMGYKVITPNFPTQENITLPGYFQILDQYASVFADNPVIIAHSIGNEMVLKYISAHNHSVDLFISLAGFSHPFTVEGRDDLNKVLSSVSMSDQEKQRCIQLIKKRVSIYSDNDHIVPLPVLEEFCNDIQSEGIMLPNIGHMGSKSGLTELPEVIKIVTSNYAPPMI